MALSSSLLNALFMMVVVFLTLISLWGAILLFSKFLANIGDWLPGNNKQNQ